MRRSSSGSPLLSSTTTNSLLLSAHASGRYLVDGNGNPFFINADTAWSICTQLNQTDVNTYLTDCVARGFNAILVELIEHEFSANPPNNVFGQAPFTGTAFQSATNPSYWSHVKWIIQKAAEYGIVVIANPCYLGFEGGTQGWQGEIEAASNAQAQAYGEFVGSYFADCPNIVWVLFGDYNPPSHTRTNAVQAGIASLDSVHTLYSAHYNPNVSSHEDTEPWFTWHWIYRYAGYGHDDTLDAYNAAPTRPVLFCEGWYELENSSSTLDQRRQAWGSVLSGALGGNIYGHRDIWGFGNGLFQADTWQNALDDTARVQMGHLRTFLSTRAWHLLQPDQSNLLVTAGRGTFASTSYVTAARASNSSWAALYIPTGSSAGAITIDRTRLSGTFNKRWYNPRSGATTNLGTSPNTGTEQFTATDTNDWVLVLEV